ncbi:MULTISPECIES: GntR family transcriptional regulator [unclassified Chelatococcus]|uniref:FadR/GntR family transcriptional regulator n=1 Tax=unclassified Chelatococcus TaxID=2638111 RepID=UPI001BCE6293|nr:MULTISPECIES: GntR family transcriptional regulator [unclassified Chelatococcus]CAH1648952.1 Transcriptional regulator, GntR family [Hyphomicrobiales bacterium]MBS7739536.1 FadR family transcriptional regulator [Chelatococcus sp. HY11]MBX3543905.1 FadR family transcriptional regulator [Chelatococcus sp.]MCO5075927.1 GntR family transcriptional regulator [Chelatococcus sp.]CAH1667832.1 Transcriptional regulator, GntR family [Hyphomicrobiales bacterium]
MLTAANRRSLVDDAIDSIRAPIEAGTWSIGSRIPTETELASLLKVSRNTVREAVRALAHSGILEVRQGDGTYVRSRTDTATLLRTLGETSFDDQLELWRIISEALARLAAERRDFEDVSRIASAIDEIFASPSKSPAAAPNWHRFYDSIADAAHNKALWLLYRAIFSSVSLLSRQGGNLLEAGCDAGAARPAQDDYRALLDAIVSQSPQDAARAARHLVDHSFAAVAGPPAEELTPPP